ncbi:hypothetical protein CASFOL_021566 [Castilleja foliolosa]|uniref:MATH domain-containing protein n=1 Tax=Castilleja foliolosa TaxID=1961234 RepID=A0ABD3CXT3_9LAMI
MDEVATKDTLADCRFSDQVKKASQTTLAPFWDFDDDDVGTKPSDLYGNFTWKVDNFSKLYRREVRSNPFDIGGYKWYVLIYPRGTEGGTHLSLFLCVAGFDNLPFGWNHLTLSTVGIVNKDPKKSKYSDTLHRFSKKEHDWGWKKFVELSKLEDGFIDDDALTIKAQVQVIRERADRPFLCLDSKYRSELMRVYFQHVELACQRFVEERRSKLLKVTEDKVRWSSLRAFWVGMDKNSKRRMSCEKTDSILKDVVNRFFIEKEVTSTLAVESLYSGLKAIEGQICKKKKSKSKCLEVVEENVLYVIVCIEKDTFALADDLLLLLERPANEPSTRKETNICSGGSAREDLKKDSVDCYQRRLTELGRQTIEISVLDHVFSKFEVAYQEVVALKKQEELIREELLEQKTRRKGMDKGKKSKKK